MTNHLMEIRSLITSIEFELMDTKPPIADVKHKLFLIREKTRKIDEIILKEFGPR